MLLRCLNGKRVACIGVTDYAHSRIGGEDALKTFGGFGRAVCDTHLTCMLAIANADPTAVMETHPCCAADCIDQGVENGPVGDGIGAIHHTLGLAVRGSDGTCIEMIAPDDDRGGNCAVRDEIVEGQACLCTI